jgi:uncharacterized protein YqkB
MNIQVSAAAVSAIKRKSGSESPVLRLLYDNEGCGCAVNGVPLLAIVAQAEAHDEAAQVTGASASDVHIYFQPLHAIYFEERMNLDYSDARAAFRLSSDGQIYSSDLRVRDFR